MDTRPLISTSALAARLDDPGLVLVDCRHQLTAPDWGRQEWTAGHIDHAAHLDLDADLSGPKTGSNGRHPLPEVGVLARTLGRLGIAAGVDVVAYDQDTGMFASRLWWLLRWLGHDSVAVLDGGLAKWRAEGRPLSTAVPNRAPREFRPAPRPQMVASVADVAAILGDADWRLLDARAPERYRGDTEPLDRVAGHIPGAANRFYLANLVDGTFKAPAELRTALAADLGAVPPNQAICYCGSGVTACHNLLALEHAGLVGARLYPGSWSEWCSDAARPIETSGES